MAEPIRTIGYAVAALSVCIATAIASFLVPSLSVAAPFLPFFAAVMIAAWFGGLGPAAFATTVSALVVDYFFMEPKHSFALGLSDASAIGLFACEAMVMAYFMDRLESRKREAINTQKQLEHLQELSGRLIEEKSLDSMLTEVLNASIDLLGAGKGALQLYDSREHALLLVRQVGFPDEFSRRFHRVPIGSHTCGKAFERKQRVVIENIEREPGFEEVVPIFQEFGVAGAQSTPLFTANGTVFGILSCYWTKPYRPTARELHVLDLYAHQAERILLYKRDEDLLRRLNDELQQTVTHAQTELEERDNKLRSMTSELFLAEERERRHLSSELHDSLAQLLAFVKIKLQLAQRSTRERQGDGERYVHEAQLLVDRSIEYTRNLMADFNPPQFDELGLREALMWLAERMGQHDLLVDLHFNCESVVLAHPHLVMVYQCVRELLFNVVKHARVNRATVSVSIDRDNLMHIAVHDQGRGFDPTASRHHVPGQHFGLRTIRERIEQMGGCLHVHSALEQGSTVRFSMPLAEDTMLCQARAAFATRLDRVTGTVKTDESQESLPLD
ncbi:MAG TPA: DUF4118 domain-containing protein [Nitrospira sp.]|nr:DUF4118 domain-containing protein [Nitrospira sp.]